MFSKILIANRGEIACRVMRSAKRLGVRTVAVYSEADAGAMHVRMADEAYLIGPAAASESYLKADKVIEIAKLSGAEAIHPGYGFLSENAGFARACETAGIVFIGPRPETIDIMGSKSRAKDLMSKAGVPLSPGYQGEDQSVATFKKAAAEIGYPVLLKAAAGGGGKGMRIVEEEGGLEEALNSAKREAKSAFGDDRFLVEKFITAPRHVEVQVFGDAQGNVVHLYERDCSVQRRYQKVVEEAPAPNLPEDVREKLLEAGVEAARAVNYIGAGTVEFLYDGGDNVYFMEMNTRLQVEHPVTEEVTGIDLVEWQLRVASGEPLPLEQDQIYCDGHAVEVRLYAEDPANDYRPSVGHLNEVTFPETRDEPAPVRIETGVATGDDVTPFYDPMIAKVIAYGEDRRTALRQLSHALRDIVIDGVRTNRDFLDRIITHPDFEVGGVTTGFLTVHTGVSMEPVIALEDLALAAASFAWSDTRNLGTDGRHARVMGWRMNLPRQHTFFVLRDGEQIAIEMKDDFGNWTASIGDTDIQLKQLRLSPGGKASALINGKPYRIDRVRVVGGVWQVECQDRLFRVPTYDPGAAAGEAGADEANLLAPMPATVTNVLVGAGTEVKAGDVILTLEAMKMEHLVKAPTDGTVTEILYTAGQTVGEGQRLVGFEAAE